MPLFYMDSFSAFPYLSIDFLVVYFLLGRDLFHTNSFQADRMLTCFNSNFRMFWGFSTHYDTPILSIHNKSFRIPTLQVIKKTSREKKFGTIVVDDAISIVYPDYLVPFLLSMYTCRLCFKSSFFTCGSRFCVVSILWFFKRNCQIYVSLYLPTTNVTSRHA
jgi:hypothetical protein